MESGSFSSCAMGYVFVSNVIVAMLYGIACVQAYTFYRQKGRDGRLFRWVIFVLWVLGTLQLIFVTQGVYYYLILNFGNPVAIKTISWGIMAHVQVSCLSDLTVRSILGRRIWLLTTSKILTVCIITTSILGFGFAFAIRALQLKTFENDSSISYLLYLGYSADLVADIFIAGSLCFKLSHSRTGMKNTNSLINILMVYTINTGLLTTITAVFCLLTYAIWPLEPIFIGAFFTMSGTYFNSLLALLNSRDTLLGKFSGIVEIPNADIPDIVLTNFAVNETGTIARKPTRGQQVPADLHVQGDKVDVLMSRV